MKFFSVLTSTIALMTGSAMAKPVAVGEAIAVQANSWETPEDIRPLNHKEIRDPMEQVRAQKEKRVSTNIDLSMVMYDELLWQDEVGAVTIEARCHRCMTQGNVHVNLTNQHLTNPRLRLDFEQVKAYIDMGIKVSSSNTFSLNLFTLNSPIGIGTSDLNVGVLLFIDLVLDITSEFDMSGGGFYVTLPDNAFIETSLFKGKIFDSSFKDTAFRSVPIVVHTANAQLKAALRVRVQAGAEVKAIGASAVLAVYANLIEFVADLSYTEKCYIEATEHFNLNIGAYAELGILELELPVPTISTTLFKSPVLTQCVIEKHPESTAKASTTTAAPTTSVAKATTSDKAKALDFPQATDAGVGHSIANVYYGAGNSTFATATPSDYGMTAAAAVTATPTQASIPPGSTTFIITICGAHYVNCPTQYQQAVTITRAYKEVTANAVATTTAAAGAKALDSNNGVRVAMADNVNAEAATTATAATTFTGDFQFPTDVTTLSSLSVPITSTLSLPYAVPTPDQHDITTVNPTAITATRVATSSAPAATSQAAVTSKAAGTKATDFNQAQRAALQIPNKTGSFSNGTVAASASSASASGGVTVNSTILSGALSVKAPMGGIFTAVSAGLTTVLFM